MLRITVDEVALYRFEWLTRVKGLTHGALTRIGGVSRGPYATLNLGHTVGDAPAAVEENHRRALSALGLPRSQVVTAYQVHGARVRRVGRGHRGTTQPATDALVTATLGVALLMRFADCAPVILFDPLRRAVGLIHAGRMGLAAGVVGAAVETMARLGCDPGDLWAGIGPTIGPCCYAVGPEVVAAVAGACPADAPVVQYRETTAYLDLPGAVRAQLAMAGVEQIEDCGICTACHTGEWFSHRAEQGKTGRFGVVVGLEE